MLSMIPQLDAMPSARWRLLLVTAALSLISGAAAFAAERHRAAPSFGTHFCDFGSDVAGVTVPSEFCIRKFADVPTPRALLFAPNGDLFVSSPERITPGGAPAGAAAIFLFRQTDPAKPPARFAFAQGPAFFSVHGILIANDSFYYTVDEGVYRVPFTVGATQIDPGSPRQVASFATAYENLARFAHSLAVGTDGSIYVSRGQYDNSTCPSPDARLGAVLRIGDGHGLLGDIVTAGLRDPLYIRCMPWGACYAAELSGDTWEEAGGTEKLIELRDGESFGYPCCISRGLPNPDLPKSTDCSTVATPSRTFPLHHTPFGFDWERSGGWPEPYRNGFFVGLHGRFGSWLNTGLQWAPTDPQTHIPTRPPADFALGFGRDGAISRVADVVFAPDGRLFFSDDQGGAIYWIAPRTLSRPKR